MTIQVTKPETPKVRKQLVERPNIQTLSLKAIVADAAFQSRIETDPAHVLTFDEMIREGHAIHPVTVFWTGERYILADGFHRYYAHLKRGLNSIQAVVIFGSERDAMIHSAGANRLSIKPPTDADRKKAVMMLLEDEEWRSKSNLSIAKHVGVKSHQTVRRYKDEFFARNGTIAGQSGGVRRRRTGEATKQGRGYKACVNGKTIYLGADREQANERLRLAKEKLLSRCNPVSRQHIVASLFRWGVVAEPAKATRCRYTRVAGGVSREFVFDTANFNDLDSIRDAILNVIILRRHECDGGRAIVLGYMEVASKRVLQIIELAKPLGVEFMTPEEFIDSFAATDESAPTDEPMLD